MAQSIAEQLKEWRGAGEDGRGEFTQLEAAEFLHVPPSTYRDWEQGRVEPDGFGRHALPLLLKKKPKKRRKG